MRDREKYEKKKEKNFITIGKSHEFWRDLTENCLLLLSRFYSLAKAPLNEIYLSDSDWFNWKRQTNKNGVEFARFGLTNRFTLAESNFKLKTFENSKVWFNDGTRGGGGGLKISEQNIDELQISFSLKFNRN